MRSFKGLVDFRDSDGQYDHQENCSKCRGKGYVEKDFWDLGEERLHKSISDDYQKKKSNGKSNKSTKNSKKNEEGGFGDIFDGLFGF